MSDGYWVTSREYRRLTKPDRIEHAQALDQQFKRLLGAMNAEGFEPLTFVLDGEPVDFAATLKAIEREIKEALRDVGPGTQAVQRDIAALEREVALHYHARAGCASREKAQ